MCTICKTERQGSSYQHVCAWPEYTPCCVHLSGPGGSHVLHSLFFSTSVHHSILSLLLLLFLLVLLLLPQPVSPPRTVPYSPVAMAIDDIDEIRVWGVEGEEPKSFVFSSCGFSSYCITISLFMLKMERPCNVDTFFFTWCEHICMHLLLTLNKTRSLHLIYQWTLFTAWQLKLPRILLKLYRNLLEVLWWNFFCPSAHTMWSNTSTTQQCHAMQVNTMQYNVEQYLCLSCVSIHLGHRGDHQFL